MKLIIAGSRNIPLNITTIQDMFDYTTPADFPLPDEIVSGAAKGIDQSGENWAEFQGIPVKRFVPDWSIGPSAVPIRNRRMAEYADALLLIWDGESKGSCNMKETMLKLNKPIYEVIIKKGT